MVALLVAPSKAMATLDNELNYLRKNAFRPKTPIFRASEIIQKDTKNESFVKNGDKPSNIEDLDKKYFNAKNAESLKKHKNKAKVRLR